MRENKMMENDCDLRLFAFFYVCGCYVFGCKIILDAWHKMILNAERLGTGAECVRELVQDHSSPSDCRAKTQAAERGV